MSAEFFSVNQSSAEKKRKDYAFRRQFNEKPNIILGCPDQSSALLQARLSLKLVCSYPPGLLSLVDVTKPN